MSAANDSNSPVMRTALSNVTADGKQTFRTSFFGFNKEAVNRYIDKLCSEFSAEENRFRAESERLTAENAELTGRVDELESAYGDMQQKVTRELSFLESFHDKEEGYRKSISDLKSTITTLAERLRSAGEMNARLNQVLKRTTAERNEASAALGQVRIDLAGKSGDRDRLIAENAELTEANENLKKEIIRKDAEIAAGLDTLDERTAAIDDLNSRLLEKDVQLRRTTQELNNTKVQVQQLSKAYTASQSKVSELQALADTQRRMTIDLKGQVDDQAKSAADTASSTNSRISALQQELSMMEKKNSDLQNALNQKYAQIQQIAARYNEAIVELKKRDTVISDMRNDLNAFARKQMDYEFKVNSLNGDIVRHQITLSQRDNEIMMLRQQLGNMEARYNYVLQQMQMMRQQQQQAFFTAGAQPVIGVAYGSQDQRDGGQQHPRRQQYS